MAAAASSSSSNVYLLDECWEYIFKFLINHDTEYTHRRYVELKPLSLVSKQFLSVTNRLRSSLTCTVYNPTCQFFHRFSNIASLDLSYYVGGDLDDLLIQISRFPLKITSLNISNQLIIRVKGLRAFSKNITTLTSLVCSNIATLYYTHMLFIAECFPLLEELDFSKPKQFKFNKTAFFPAQALSLALPKLRKVNVANYYISNELLFHMCKNCKLLKEVNIINCWRITLSDIAADLHERPTLSSLSFSASKFHPLTSSFIDSLVILKGLTSLDLFNLRISDELLSSIAMEGLPLTRLGLRNCSGCSYTGIYSLLSKSPCIQHLILQRASCLNNQHVAELSLFLDDLISINLSRCKRLTESALFALVRNCPSLIEINMGGTSIGKESVRNSNSSKDPIVNSQLKSLYLANCEKLRDETIIRFSSIFSNLQLLDLNSFQPDEDIGQVFRRFCNIRHLNLAKCPRVKLLVGMNFELPNLEVLNLSCTSVGRNVTQKGVKHVLENCTQLREINLRNCSNVDRDVCSVLLSSLSLRKIIAPSRIRFTKGTMKLFSHHGCRVCKHSAKMFHSLDLDAGIALALRDRLTLKSLSIAWIELNHVTSQYIDSFVS
ncbi:F-box/LRR-repeat protein 3-like [Vicia villosa]|uniref:F-box/LRR-repeat protein 3-like n=1 Tax=Vicia villosa TaxID=3911 RepID=UPI00273ABA34|nr:F-box/LRR-repeat protein 3-like [Vicia villosa]